VTATRYNPTTLEDNAMTATLPTPVPATGTNATPAAVTTPPGPKPDGIQALLDDAKASPVKDVARLAVRIARDLDRLREKIEQSREQAEALAEVARLTEQLKAAKIKAGRKPTRNPKIAELHRQHAEWLAARGTTHADVRAWARLSDIPCPDRGSLLPRSVRDAYDRATGA
jgi:hypothetical protein